MLKRYFAAFAVSVLKSGQKSEMTTEAKCCIPLTDEVFFMILCVVLSNMR